MENLNLERKKSISSLASEILNKHVDPKEREEMIHILLTKQAAQDTSKYTYGERVSDKMARIAGSWVFIISFCFVLLIWIGINVYLLSKPFDPYPFILLNLVLSCLAAIQAPVILMSQNRQEQKDRERAENDYRVNLKAEIILEDLHHKVDRISGDYKVIKAKLEELIKLNENKNETEN